MFKYILVPATGTDADLPVFRTAVALGRLHGGHLLFLHVRLDVQKLIVPIAPAEFGGGAGIDEYIEALEQDALARHDRAKSAVYAFCAGRKIAMSRTPIDGFPTAEGLVETGDEADWLARLGRAADVVVLGRVRDDKAAAVDVLDAMLMEAGRPLLIVPPQPPPQIGQVVTIAWKDTPEAAGAVTAALPLLAEARRVVILSVTEDVQVDPAACERLREALTWHNVATTVQHLAPEGLQPADRLAKIATEIGTDLLVMGGYSHSRRREVVFGGFTRRVLRTTNLPVLMTH